jgi:rabenosyn-5
MHTAAQVTNHFSSDGRPAPEASAARKRLLDAFAQYDALAKRIRVLPTSGPGSSQDRVLAAVHTRANIFLQKHMFPLQVSTNSDALVVSY